jgi:hypothetical protein
MMGIDMMDLDKLFDYDGTNLRDPQLKEWIISRGAGRVI